MRTAQNKCINTLISYFFKIFRHDNSRNLRIKISVFNKRYKHRASLCKSLHLAVICLYLLFVFTAFDCSRRTYNADFLVLCRSYRRINSRVNYADNRHVKFVLNRRQCRRTCSSASDNYNFHIKCVKKTYVTSCIFKQRFF